MPQINIMSSSDTPSDTQNRLNPNPFDSAGSESDSQNWARNVASAEADKSSTSRDPEKHKTEHNDDENLTAIDTVKSVAHTAKQKLHLHSVKATGPSTFFHPTNVRVHVKWKDDGQHPSRSISAGHSSSLGRITNERAYLWRSRDNRKGRNSVAVPTSGARAKLIPLRSRLVSELRQISKHVLRMCMTFPYWDMAFWSGWSYSWGSVLFIIDSAWAWKDVAEPESQPESLTKWGSPLCFFFGALLYQLGATMAYFEAVNDGSFQGSAMQRFLDGNEEDSKKMLDEKIHAFFGHLKPHLHHRHGEKGAGEAVHSVDPEAGWKAKDRNERPGSIYPSGKAPAPRRGGIDFGESQEGTTKVYTTWRWWPTWHALRTHHVYEIGYLACAIQLFGATLYGITGVVDLPGILTSLAHWQKEAAFWIPQIVASVCFVTASVLFTLETQEKWYRPEPGVIGWWIGAWALVGSIGFLSVHRTTCDVYVY